MAGEAAPGPEAIPKRHEEKPAGAYPAGPGLRPGLPPALAGSCDRLFYGIYLHARFFLGWKGKRAAWLVIGCFALSFITAFVIPFVVPTIHESYFT